MEHLAESIYPKDIDIFGFTTSQSVVISFIIVLVLMVLLIIFRFVVFPRFKTVPGGFQAIIEWFVSAFNNMSESAVGKKKTKFLGPYIFTVTVFISVNVLVELFRIRSPIADINTCLALALLTFFLINFYGIKKHGLVGRVKYYFKPVKVAAPIRMIDDLLVPVSMTFRLFGSVLSGMLIMELIYSFIPVVLPAFMSIMFTIFHAVMQSYIFATLTVTFIAEASE